MPNSLTETSAEQKSHPRQKIDQGYGPVYHRLYSIDFPGSMTDARRAMRVLQKDLNRCSPQLLAHFERQEKTSRELRSGEEFQIHITGPWNGPVRVAEVTGELLRLETLEGHLEAGEVWFRVLPVRPGVIRFQVESVARSHNLIVDFVYDKIPIAKMVQTQMWSHFCKSFAELAAAETHFPLEQIGEVQVVTERRAEGATEWETL